MTALVLDTNVVLDCFHFQDPGCQALRTALEMGHPWLATAAMREELSHVLARGIAGRWRTKPAQVLAAFDRHARLVPEAPVCRLVCTDADDQKFVDLAIAACAGWLLTSDRALLALARRARAHGVSIARPAAWRQACGQQKGAAEAAP